MGGSIENSFLFPVLSNIATTGHMRTNIYSETMTKNTVDVIRYEHKLVSVVG